MFKIVGTVDRFIPSTNTHHATERANRDILAARLIQEENGAPIMGAIVDKGHVNGYEIHIIYNNGIVKVYNQATGKYITCLIARLPQITRYGIKPTKTMQAKIKRHIANGYNET